ncbi:MAG: hypothetical protein CUN52_11985 [Phototrophicales bacterium]|nr:MAG: hypothetical protein CUN52_11985 [Phototrophicales bacterium]
MADSDTTTNLIMLLRKFGHDMRVPLNTLISTSDMLVRGAYDALTPKQEKAATRLQRNSYRLLAILDDFITLIKADAGDLTVSPKSFNIKEKLDEWAKPTLPILDPKGVQLSIIVSESTPMMMNDEALLKRIVQALLWNAVSFTERGTIKIVAEYQADSKWHICVEDTGSGIPNQDLPHIFEPFWRGEARPQVPTAGAGLGLPLSRALARLLNGDVSLQSTSGQGTCFCVELPVQSTDSFTTNIPSIDIS